MGWRLSALTLGLRLIAKPRLARTAGPEAAAHDLDRHAPILMRQPAHLLHLRRPGGLHWISAGHCAPRRVILYFHGGGYISGSPRTHQGVMARLSQLSGIEVCAPEYPLVQEAPFPAQFDAACAAWERLDGLGYTPDQVVLAGDSAGGGLALALLGDLCVRGHPPAGALAFSPWTDLAMTGASLSQNARSDPFLPVARMRDLVDVVGGAQMRADPRLSPLYATFPACPPVRLTWSRSEILADDGLRMAARLRAEGARVEVETHATAPHAWPVFDGWIPEARATLRRAAAFVQDLLRDTSR
ncbi:alpha/beta hydrolase fold domain-containing protein [Salipiger mangrovisoli]|uniref:Alpha/beta hydrolase fold domain-containing protein n=1 Tax=Salipiger mangrovisoli TaxID=2865933 RepID=A0ABR9X5L3_9RHOB|nr:alpha/beta hydrolase [Salipiger mangrovisoli]MBE9638893.1 alpha/beta hydrolase fold domain-containing protein [Salipiger mangrovisoli]